MTTKTYLIDLFLSLETDHDDEAINEYEIRQYLTEILTNAGMQFRGINIHQIRK